MKRMIKVPYVSLPNLLAKKSLVPELIQDEASPEKLAKALLHEWKRFKEEPQIENTFMDLHEMLRKNAGEAAASAIAQEIQSA